MKRLSLLLSLLLIAACDTEGPEGPQGPAGTDGAANVSSVTFTVHADAFSAGSVAQLHHDIPEITDDILSDGVVLAYWGSGDGRWLAMPVSLHVTGASTTLSYAIERGVFIVQVFSSLAEAAQIFDGGMIRVVLIPPGASKRDYSDYAALALAFGLEP